MTAGGLLRRSAKALFFWIISTIYRAPASVAKHLGRSPRCCCCVCSRLCGAEAFVDIGRFGAKKIDPGTASGHADRSHLADGRARGDTVGHYRRMQLQERPVRAQHPPALDRRLQHDLGQSGCKPRDVARSAGRSLSEEVGRRSRKPAKKKCTARLHAGAPPYAKSERKDFVPTSQIREIFCLIILSIWLTFRVISREFDLRLIKIGMGH